MKYKVQDLYYAKCRHFIMDIINVLDDDGQIMSPHPDFYDYYTILLFRNNRYVNIYDRQIKYERIQLDNNKEYYGGDVILEINSLSDYIDLDNQKISFKECKIIDSTVKKTKSLNIKYGYKR